MFSLVWTIVTISLAYKYLTLGKKGLTVQSRYTLIFNSFKLLPEKRGLFVRSQK